MKRAIGGLVLLGAAASASLGAGRASVEGAAPGKALRVAVKPIAPFVLKHAHARHIRVATAVDAGQVSISVSDDGRGFDGSASARGYGLTNMRGRTRTIGGDLRIEPTAYGTTLSLVLPIG